MLDGRWINIQPPRFAMYSRASARGAAHVKLWKRGRQARDYIGQLQIHSYIHSQSDRNAVLNGRTEAPLLQRTDGNLVEFPAE